MRKLAPVLLLFFITACTTTPADLLRTAQTPAQHAFALYGTFVVFEETVADIVERAGTPQVVKNALKAADAVAKPLADVMLVSARSYVAVEAQLANGDPDITFNDLKMALKELTLAIKFAGPSINALVSAVQNL